MMTPGDFEKKWEIGRTLPAAFRSAVEGEIVPWHTDPNWLATLDGALETVPRRVIERAGVNVVIVVEGLKVDGRPAEAANSVYDPALEKPGARHAHPPPAVLGFNQSPTS